MFETTLAKILGVTALVLLSLSFAVTFKESGAVIAIFSFCFGVIGMLILILDHNCVFIGGCNIWGWIKFLATMFFMILFIVALILILIKDEPKPTVSEQKTQTQK